MWADLELDGLDVLVVGSAQGTRRVRARVEHAGGRVMLVGAAQALELLSASDRAVGLVVWVEGPESARAEGRALARIRRLPVTCAPSATTTGTVTLVGGGPGRTDLLTLAGQAALADADVVLFDRLGPQESLADLAPGARLIDVGKAPGHHPIPQPEIEAMLVEHARAGAHVVRLKGGDPFVFGRGSEEVRACARAGVPVTVVPGVSSAIAVPGAAGIPVTHRGLSRSLTIVSGHVPFEPQEYAHLHGVGGTLVILMGVNTLIQVCTGLLRAGMPPDVPLALVERGFLPGQRTTVTTVAEVVRRGGMQHATSPAVVVIGAVVALAESSGWEDLARTVEGAA